MVEEDVFYVEISPPSDVNNELSRSLYSKHKLHRLIHDEQHSYLRESWTNGHIKEKHEMKHSSQSFNKHIVSIGDFKKDQYDWKRHLNWATEDNPDGVAIVNPASDQVNLHLHSFLSCTNKMHQLLFDIHGM